MSKLKDLIQEAEVILVSPDTHSHVRAGEDPKYIAILKAIQGLRDNAQLARLFPDELANLKSLLKIVILAAAMSPSAAQNQLRAVYTAEVKQALLKIDAGHAVCDALEDVVDADHMVGPQA